MKLCYEEDYLLFYSRYGFGVYSILRKSFPVLVADKTEFVADGEDEVSFTIMKDGEDITHTPGVSVCCEGTLSTCLPPSENGFKFSTSIAGEYIFSASYEGEHSEPVTVNAI